MRPPKYRSFNIGFVLTVALFIVLNITSFLYESSSSLDRELNLERDGIKLSAGGYSWGFPFKMYFSQRGYPNYVGFELIPTLLNIAFGIGSGLGLGMILQLTLTRQKTKDPK